MSSASSTKLTHPWIWYFSVSLVLYLFYSFNPWNAQTDYGNSYGKYEDGIDSFSEGFVWGKVIEDFLGQENNGKGFLLEFSQPRKPGDYGYRPGAPPYKSQFGLQGRVYSFLARIFGAEPRNEKHPIFRIFRELNAWLLSLTLALFILAIVKEFGPAVGLLLTLLLATSAGPVLFAKNLYWVTFLHFLPFCFFWFVYPRLKGNLTSVGLCSMALLFFKSLNGYEDLTCITLSAFVPVLYYEPMEGSRRRDAVKACSVIFAGSVAGFVLAALVHLSCFESFREGVHFLYQRGAYRSFTYISPLKSLRFLLQPIWVFPILGQKIKFAMLAPALFCYFLSKIFRRRPSKSDLILLCSVVSTASWFVFGYQHILWHTWIFYLTINLCLLPMVNLYLSLALVRGLSWQWSKTKLLLSKTGETVAE